VERYLKTNRPIGVAIAGLLMIALQAGGAAGESSEPRWLVEAPTAGMMPTGRVAIDVRAASGRSVLADVELGLWNRVLVGVSFGGQNLFGSGSSEWNPDPGVSGRFRLLNETSTRPALAVGFRSQGSGVYDDVLGRYHAKSLGIYAVFSRNYWHPTGQVGVHFGLNRSLEDGDGDDTLTGFFGGDLEFWGRVAVVGEYHFALNDDGGMAQGKGRGYLNVGIRWLVTKTAFLEFDLKDVFENNGRAQRPVREVRVVFLRR
jgi:hypothetical protein